MRYKFADGVSNVERFEAGIQRIEGRGAAEACWMLVEGEAGYGKTETGKWWAVQHDAIQIRIKGAATYHWVLADVLRAVNRSIQPKRRCEALYDQVYRELAREQRPLVIDEVENILHDLKAIQAIKDLTDFLEIPVVLIARKFVAPKLRQREEIWSRIVTVVEFGPATLDDVRLICDELSEVPIDDEVVARIHRESEGRVREVLNAIAAAERIGARIKGPVTATQVANEVLVKDHQRSKTPLRVVK
jgi:hypothetical protein